MSAAGLFTTDAMAEIFSPAAHIGRMLAVEAALARAQAAAGLIPSAAAVAIVAACQVERFDVGAIYRHAASAGTLAIPLVQALVAEVGPEGAPYVHWGATSQDIIDTALALQMRAGLDLLLADLAGIGAACAALAQQHRQTLMVARTLLQQALPIPFGLKAARWLGVATRQAYVLRAERGRLALQLGGAAGTLAALGAAGLDVAELLAADLGLDLPALPWHAERDRVAGLAASVGVAAGAVAKIAADIVLMAQTEVAEVAEGAAPGRGGSSAMPQKRNPVDSIQALAAARLAAGQVSVFLNALPQEHERAAGGWQAEWVAIPELFRAAAGALAHTHAALAGLQVDVGQLRANLERSGGLVMAESLATALAAPLGRPIAQRLVQEVCARAVAQRTTLLEAALATPEIAQALSVEQLAQALDPSKYLGSADRLIDRALEEYRQLVREEGSHAER
jgi:3-carboxy-cis,cis-muconate cycloisomerase